MQFEKLKITVVVPVFNRPSEVEELLKSLSLQTDKDFDILIVEDGSTLKCDAVVNKYSALLDIKYYYKENTGPGQSRNYGCERASGNYCIFFDSDCIIPQQYIEIVKRELSTQYVDAFGGPDGAHNDFNNMQKAINYAMTSFFTTGGIRGGGEKLEKFNPRSFNMGISREVFQKTGGFPSILFAHAKAAGEDLDLSLTIKEMGFSTRLLKEAFVFHKRRTNLKQFIRQVYNFGYARITVSLRHPGSLKILHLLPLMFTGFVLTSIVMSFISLLFLIPLCTYITIVFVDSSIKNKSIQIGLLSSLTSILQLIGYGLGFIEAFVKKVILKRH